MVMAEKFTVDGNIGELSPGVTPRRYTPPGGIRKHNEKIHRESKYADTYKNLPFTFSKPKRVGRTKLVECCNCGNMARVGINAVGMICEGCKTYSSVKEVEEDG
jgi:hypothetical protein